MSIQKMEATGCVNMKFIVFLKMTLGKMVGNKTLPKDFINLHFWQKWPRKFYNVKSYNGTKQDFLMGCGNDDNGSGSDDETPEMEEYDDNQLYSQSREQQLEQPKQSQQQQQPPGDDEVQEHQQNTRDDLSRGQYVKQSLKFFFYFLCNLNNYNNYFFLFPIS